MWTIMSFGMPRNLPRMFNEEIPSVHSDCFSRYIIVCVCLWTEWNELSKIKKELEFFNPQKLEVNKINEELEQRKKELEIIKKQLTSSKSNIKKDDSNSKQILESASQVVATTKKKLEKTLKELDELLKSTTELGKLDVFDGFSDDD